MKGVFIKDLTYPQCCKMIDENSVIVLPIGGGSKEHGSHLPMGTDWYVTEYFAQELTKECAVITLPTLPYAYFPAFVEWKGSVSIEANHFADYVEDILMSFVRFGVRKFLIIDGGVSTHIPLSILAQTMHNHHHVTVVVTDIGGLGAEIESKVCQRRYELSAGKQRQQQPCNRGKGKADFGGYEAQDGAADRRIYPLESG